MLDETLPPDGDHHEDAGRAPAHEPRETVVPADEAGALEAPQPVDAAPAADQPAAAAVAAGDARTAVEPDAEAATADGGASLTATDATEGAVIAAEGAEATSDAVARNDAATGEDAAARAAEAEGAAAAPAKAQAPEMSPAICATQLAERFPGLFAAGRALPIKLRVQVDIHARAPGVFTRKAMSLFLHRYTTSTPYLKALVASPHRFDLDGAPAGEVAAEHREAAQVELQRRQAIVQEKRSAQRRMDRPPRPGQGPRGGPAQAGLQGTQDAAGPADAQVDDHATSAAPLAGDGVRLGGGGQPRGPRPDGRARPPQPQRQQRDDRRPPGQARPPAGAQPGTGQRNADGTPQGPRSARPPRPPQPVHRQAADAISGQQPRGDQQPQPTRQPSLPPAELEARRERAALLRAYESSTLTKANFCVLKRIREADLDSALAQARQERGEMAPRPASR